MGCQWTPAPVLTARGARLAAGLIDDAPLQVDFCEGGNSISLMPALPFIGTSCQFSPHISGQYIYQEMLPPSNGKEAYKIYSPNSRSPAKVKES